MTSWTDNSSSFNGKQLHAVHRLDSDTFLECHLWYTAYVPEGRKPYTITYAEAKELGSVITLHVVKMRKDGNAWTGGLGRTMAVSADTYKRKTLKDLQKASDKLTVNDILMLGDAQSTEPTRIFG